MTNKANEIERDYPYFLTKNPGWWYKLKCFWWPTVKYPFQTAIAWLCEKAFNLRARLHRCKWDDGDPMGRYMVHDCTVPGCMKTSLTLNTEGEFDPSTAVETHDEQ